MGYDKKRRETLCGTGFRVKIWCNSEPCGVICAALTWIFILFAEYCVIGVVLYPWLGPSFQMAVHSTLYSIIAFLGLASHGKAMLTDPGSVPENAIPIALAMASKEEQLKYEEQRYRSCRRCQTFKPSRAHHCSICERCVVKMDHHCPWVNNCVGLGNHKFFLLFIFYVFLMSAYALVLVLWRYMDCMQRTQCPQDGAVLVILLTVEGVLFGLFTLCMMCDQYSVITTGATQIDRLKGEVVETEGIREVFGGLSNKPTISWFLPVEIWFPSSMKHQILGYALWSPKEEEEASEQDPFIQDGESGSVSSSTPSTTVTKETLEGGWLVEKHVDAPSSDVQIV